MGIALVYNLIGIGDINQLYFQHWTTIAAFLRLRV